jgi:hypothetical protein
VAAGGSEAVVRVVGRGEGSVTGGGGGLWWLATAGRCASSQAEVSVDGVVWGDGDNSSNDGCQRSGDVMSSKSGSGTSCCGRAVAVWPRRRSRRRLYNYVQARRARGRRIGRGARRANKGARTSE